MKHRIFASLAAWLFVIAATRADASWLTDYDAALRQARTEGKPVLINFTGSDWCGWCIRLKAEVFDTKEFAEFAKANVVLLEVDLPRRKPMSAAQRARNESLAQKYGVPGFPTVLLLDAGGRTLLNGGYMPGGVGAFIGHFRSAPGVKWKDGTAASPAASATTRSPAPPAPAAAEPWADVAAPPKRYEDLKLTGLSGPANRRLAIINNQTFAPGETARVKLKGGEVQLLCKEIRAKSVVVQMEDGTTVKELFLNTN